MATLDVYRITNQLDDATLGVLATRLEARGRHPRFSAMLHDYLEEMDIDTAGSVLDMGCGTGFAARTIAGRAGFSGHVIGVDRSQQLVVAASRLALDEGLGKRASFSVGDSHGLELGDASVDAVVAHTLMSHLEHPAAVLAEIVRVLKPGGTLGVFDGDYASMTFASDDPAAGKAVDEKIIAAIVTNPRIMRQMPELLRNAGLTLQRSFAYVVADVGQADFWASSIQSMTKLLPKSGAMTEGEAAEWAAAMFRRSDAGTFFGASNYYSYVARKPRV
jgi:ubiquinone/menaquinone biosynthesis C-methylase UbiE